MNLVIWIWVASIAGAFLFFAAGYLLKGNPAPASAPAADLVEDPRLASMQETLTEVQARAAQSESSRQSLEVELQAAQQQVANLEPHYEYAVALERQVNDLQTKLQEQREAAGASAAQLAKAQVSAVRAATPAPDLAAHRELYHARARIAELETAAGASSRAESELQEFRRRVAQEHGALVDRTQELERDNAELERAVMNLEAVSYEVEALRKAAAERDSLRMDIEALSRRVEATDAVHAENDRLHRLEAENERLRTRLKESEAHVTEFQALGLMRQPKPVSESAKAGSSLEDVVLPLASVANARSTVVADDLGFPIVGYGEHQEPLAALCGLLVDLDRHAQRLLPLGSITEITLHAEHGARVSACRWRDPDVTLTLATLTAGPGPEPGRLESILGQVANTLLLAPNATTDRSNV